jgi:hypothetical protein
MPLRTVSITRTQRIPDDVLPEKKWGKTFKRESGFALKVLKYWMSVFIDERLTAFNPEYLKELYSTEATPAHLVSCVGERWNVVTEPIGKKQLGIIIYTASGKALASGTAELLNSQEIHLQFSTLYPNITNATKLTIGGKATIKQTPAGTEYGAEVTASVEFPRD